MWRHYLRAWAEDEKIFCKRNKKVFISNLMGVGLKKNFYRLQELTNDDIFWLNKMIIEPSPEFLQSFHREILNSFQFPFKMIKLLKEKGLSTAEIENQTEILINNAEEKLHGIIEVDAIPYLKSLLEMDTSFFESDEGKMGFLHYIFTQYLRTNKMKTNTIDSFKADYYFVQGKKPKSVQDKELEISRIANVMNHMLTKNMTHFLIRDNYRIIIIENKSSIPFITCDQPVFNTHAVGKHISSPISDLQLYYPISPQIAILITKDDLISTFKIECFNTKEIDGYNNAVIIESHEQVYGNSEEILKRYN